MEEPVTAQPESAKPERRKFKAEISQLLDIVVHSLYTDREIFLRELVSNASDALERLQFVTLTEKEYHDRGLPLQIVIDTDREAHVVTVTDTGIGMTRDEMEKNLGTIAHSGAKEFLRSLSSNAAENLQLIGQFGLGFYSVFMVAERVRVRSRSYKLDEQGYEWASDGQGSYTLTPMDGVPRGTQVIVELKEDAREFADPATLRSIVRRYSNFVGYPIRIGGEQINTIQALWTRNKKDITEDEYVEFYRFVASAADTPVYTMHLQSDAPIQINALLFVPGFNPESLGLGKLAPGVHLYCRRVLIQQDAPGLLPEFLRFLRGVVDSMDLPLNVSRESMQDSRLMARLRKVLTERFLRFLSDQAKENPDQYLVFWESFGRFLKEGVTHDPDQRARLAPLLRFESSALPPGKVTSLAEYVERMVDGQTAIYFLSGPGRAAIESGPYMEAFRTRNVEVLYLFDPIDDFVLTTIAEFEGHKLISADSADLRLPQPPTNAEASQDEAVPPADHADAFISWLKETLGTRISDVRPSARLSDSPVVIVNPDDFMTTSMQRVLQTMERDVRAIGSKVLEVNLRHPIIRRMVELHMAGRERVLLEKAAGQLLDNALISAGLLTDVGVLVSRTYSLIEAALGVPGQTAGEPQQP